MVFVSVTLLLLVLVHLLPLFSSTRPGPRTRIKFDFAPPPDVEAPTWRLDHRKKAAPRRHAQTESANLFEGKDHDEMEPGPWSALVDDGVADHHVAAHGHEREAASRSHAAASPPELSLRKDVFPGAGAEPKTRKYYIKNLSRLSHAQPRDEQDSSSSDSSSHQKRNTIIGLCVSVLSVILLIGAAFFIERSTNIRVLRRPRDYPDAPRNLGDDLTDLPAIEPIVMNFDRDPGVPARAYRGGLASSQV